MARCSQAALEVALRQLSEHAAGNRARSNWIFTFLTAQRMVAAGYPMTIAGANEAVEDLFVLVPNHPRGRSNPFVNLESGYRWGKVEDAGRSTAWNTGTRQGAQRVLFTDDHFSNGLRADAIDRLLHALGDEEPLPARDALAVFLTRDHNWDTEPSRQDLHEAASAVLALDQADFERITSDAELEVPVLGDPEWTVAQLETADIGPPPVNAADDAAGGLPDDIPIESVHDLPEQFRLFLAHHGIATASPEERLDLLAATLSSQFLLMAGPSGSGKSLMASALAAFFAPPERRRRLEASRLLAKPEEFFGYYSHLAGEKFVAHDQLLEILPLEALEGEASPMIVLEEANLSPIEGYMAPLVHGMGDVQTDELPIRLHAQGKAVDSQTPGTQIPAILNLGPYPRVFATLNVDADSPAPARKVVSRACVMLLETPTFATALAATDSLVNPSVEEATGPAAALIGRPEIAHNRYVATGSTVYQEAMGERAELLREALGMDVIAHRQLNKSLMYMGWYVELAGVDEPEADTPAVRAAADNALVHFVLPSLPPAQFARAIEALDDGARTGVLAQRLGRLRSVLSEYHFGPPPDFWGALS